ncbi:MAG: chloride channel protein, partial [Prochlorotrichaceae cyanobacterium]
MEECFNLGRFFDPIKARQPQGGHSSGFVSNLRWRSQVLQQLGLNPKETAVLEACLIGLVSGVAAVLLKQSVGILGTLRVRQVELGWVWLPLIGALGGFLAGWLSQTFAVETTGSGIPQVKAALARVPQALNLRVAGVKLLSTLLVMGSGMSLGRQGPTVQIGAALAGEMRHWVPTSPDHRRQMIAAGAAAGLAAGFNAPLAGVMFVIEELLQDLSSLTLGTAIIASFMGAMVSR